MKKLSYILLVCTTLVMPEAIAGSRANFLSHGPSAEAYGRGEAAVSCANDMGAAFYNPALLTSIPCYSASFSHYPLYEGSKYSFAGIGSNIEGVGSIGLSLINLSSGEVELRTDIAVDPDEVTSANDWAYLLSYARAFPRLYNISAGVNIKYIKIEMHKYSGSSTGADLGLSRSITLPAVFESDTELKLAFSAMNIVQPSITLISQADTYETSYRLGASWHVPTVMRALDFDSASIYADASMEDNSIAGNYGLEYAFAGRYIARGGMYADHYTAGLGYRLPILRVDYAIDFAGFTSFNRFTISYFWGGDKRSAASKQRTAEKISPESIVSASSGPATTEISDLMSEAQQALALNNEQQKARDKEINILYKDAKKDYSKKRYLTATEKFSSLLISYPECKNAGKYYLRITEKMFGTATADSTSDFEELSYAKGYVAYKKQEYANALNEWEKVMQSNPKRTELAAYIKKVGEYLNDQARAAREREANARAQAYFDEGVTNFNESKYVGCIKKMEKLQEFCRKQDDFSKAADWTNKAGEYITKAITGLSLSLKNDRKNAVEDVKASEEKKPEVELDTEGADKKYKEGLILYAQGKISDAVNMWEISIRLNPGHEKARKAISKASEDLKK